MKNLIPICILCCLLDVNSLNLNAQTNVNLEKVSRKNHIKNAPRFIDDIELIQSQKKSTILTEVDSHTAEPKKETEKIVYSRPPIEKCNVMHFKYALLTDENVEAISNDSLYQFIDNWWETRYAYGGTTHNGIDCSAFAGYLIKEVFNFILPRTAREQYDICEKISKEDLKEGDLVFFNTRGGVSHVGVYLTNRRFVHSSVNTGVTINSLDEDYYSRKFISGGRIIR